MKIQLTQKKETSVGSLTELRLGHENGLFAEEPFQHILYLERKRRERSLRPMLLLLIDVQGVRKQERDLVGSKVAHVVTKLTRETDIKGWYREGQVVGIIYTELNAFDEHDMVRKIKIALKEELSAEQVQKLEYSIHVFPQQHGPWEQTDSDKTVFYPDVSRRYGLKRGAVLIKRVIDIAGSITGLLLFSPLFVLIPVIIRATSPGPVLFRQERMGLYGKPFTFFKFRTMHVNSDATVHQEYVRKLIEGVGPKDPGGMEPPANDEKRQKVFKITNDKRVTPFGHVLRKSSMDELPQFLNVLRGEMSLVGPRPPIPYEVQNYSLWHLSRVVEVKPGITGLWQVTGRSSTTFDEMVRLDIKYARKWTIWLDLKILFLTPWAVLRGKGAY
jgi:lipopolysaccharide/colanic/teichoic acid biosynthesis glycosyltransferase